MDLKTLALSRSGQVLTVRIDNPPSDLMDAHVLADLDYLGRRLAKDTTIRAVIITGPRPGVFVPHYELAEIVEGSEALGLPSPYALSMGSLRLVKTLGKVPGASALINKTPASGLVQLLGTHATLTRFSRLPQVVIAAIDGDALGGGCEVALACDIRLMGDGDYRIGLPEISAGILPGAGGTARLAQVLGSGRAASMVLQAKTLTPQQAADVGLVDAVCSDVVERAEQVAQRVAQWNPLAVRSAKRALLATRGLDVEAAGFMTTVSHGAAIERLKEFVAQPRSPWQDRSWL